MSLLFQEGQEGGPGDDRPVSLTLIPGKVIERLTLEGISRHVKGTGIIWTSQHGFNQGESMLDQPDCLLSCHHSLGRLGRAVGVVYLDFSKAFDAVSHNILVMKLRKCGINEWTVM